MGLEHRLLLVRSAQHFLVDGLCACALYLMSGRYGTESVVGIFIAYNVLAFLTQPLTGMVADRVRRSGRVLAASLAFLSLAVAAVLLIIGLDDGEAEWWSLLCVAVQLGVGNSFFHVWGGRETAVRTGNDIRALGVFVSTGALGLAVGAVCASWPLLCAFLLVLIILSLRQLRLPAPASQRVPTAASVGSGALVTVVAMVAVMTFVAFRSAVGGAFSSVLSRSAVMVLLVAVLTTAGKMAGGWIARGLGLWRGAVLMVLASVACITINYINDYSGAPALAGLFAINCTMPVTLYLANRLMPGREATAFGLLAAALMPPYLLTALNLL